MLFPRIRTYAGPSYEGVDRASLPVGYFVDSVGPQSLVVVWESLVTQLFLLGSQPLADEVPASARAALESAVQSLGVRLLGSAALVSEVLCVLGDGPAEGDLFGALELLWEGGVVALGASAKTTLRASGLCSGSFGASLA